MPQTTPTSQLPSSSREAPGRSLPFDLCLSQAFHHILVDLNHRKAAAKGTKDARCSSGAMTFLSTQDPAFLGIYQGPPRPPARLLLHQQCRYQGSSCSDTQFLTAILNISPRPLSQQRSALWGDTSPAAEALTREAEGTLASPTSQCSLFRGSSGALWRLPDLWNWSFTPINYFLSWQGERSGGSSASARLQKSSTCPWAPHWSEGDLEMWAVMQG